MTGGRPPQRWDAGLQNERTALAWRRTAMSVAAVAILFARVMLYDNTPLAGAVAIGGVGTAAAMAAHSDRRYERADRASRANGPLFDARIILLCSCAGIAIGILIIAALLQ